MEIHLELSDGKAEEMKEEVSLPSRRNLSIKEWKNKHKAKINASERKRKERVSNSINLLRQVLDNQSDLTSKESVIKAATKCIVGLREKIEMMLKCGTTSNMELELKSLQEKNKVLEEEKEYYMKILKSYSIPTVVDKNSLSTKAKKVKILPLKKKDLPIVQLSSSPAPSVEVTNFCSTAELCSSQAPDFHHMNEYDKSPDVDIQPSQVNSESTSQMESVYNSKPFPSKYCSLTWTQAKIKESDKNLNDVTSVLSNTENPLEVTSHNITAICDNQIKRGRISKPPAPHMPLETYDVNIQNKCTNNPTQFYSEVSETHSPFQSKLKRVTKSSSFTIDDLIQNPLTTKPNPSNHQPQYETYIPVTPTFNSSLTSGNYYHEKDVEATSFYQSTNKQPSYENQFSCRTLYHPQPPKPNHNTTTLWQPAINNMPKSTNANLSQHGTTAAPMIEKNYDVTAESHHKNSGVNCSFSSTPAYNHVTNQTTFIPSHYMQQTHIEPIDPMTDGNLANSHDFNQRSQPFTDHHNVWLAKKSKGPTPNQLNGSNPANSIWQLIDC